MPVYVHEILNRNRGMFSVVNEVVDQGGRAERGGYALVVHWRSGYEQDGLGANTWPYYFEPCFDVDEARAEIAGVLPVYGDREDNLIAPRGFGGLALPTDRHAVKGIIDRRVRLRPRVRERIEVFARRELGAGRRVVGLHIRGPGRPLPALTRGHDLEHGVPFRLYFAHVDEALERYGDSRILLCSDSEMVVETVRRRYGDRVFTNAAERPFAGEPHLRQRGGGQGYKLGEDVLVEAMLLSRVDFLVHGNSNVTNYVLCNNPELAHDYVFANAAEAPGTVRRPVSARPRRFVAACLRAHHEADGRGAVHALMASEPPDWGGVMEVAGREQVGPLLFRALRREAFVPAGVLRRLHHAYLRAGSGNMILLKELDAVAENLRSAGVAPIVLGGAALARTAYGNVALRPFASLELLLRPEDVEVATEVLAARGFLPRGARPASEDPVVLAKAGSSNVTVELHRALFHSPFLRQRVDVDLLRRTAMPIPTRGAGCFVLGPAAMLLHVAGDLVLRHGGVGLLRQHDVATLLHAHASVIDWPRLLEWARAFALGQALREAVLHVHDGGAPVPAEVIEQIRGLAPANAPRSALGHGEVSRLA